MYGRFLIGQIDSSITAQPNAKENEIHLTKTFPTEEREREEEEK